MKLYAPGYYNDFKCIADKCTHSCCIGWDVDIDRATAKIYSQLDGGYGDIVKNSVSKKGGAHFSMTEDGRCPHLDEKGLCRIITELGEENLCQICREHPRFYNRTANGMEIGIGASCEEACRIILASDGYADILPIGEVQTREKAPEINALPYREKIFALLNDESKGYSEKIKSVEMAFGVSPSVKNDDEWREILGQLEYIDERHRSAFLFYSSNANVDPENEKKLIRAFAYFVYRHTSAAFDEADFKIALAFALFCQKLLETVVKKPELWVTGSIEEALRVISEEIEYSPDNTENIKLELSFSI